MKNVFMSIMLFAGAMLSVVSCSQKKTESSEPVAVTEENYDKILDEAMEEYVKAYIAADVKKIAQLNLWDVSNDTTILAELEREFEKKKREKKNPIMYSVVESVTDVTAIDGVTKHYKHYLISWGLSDGTTTEECFSFYYSPQIYIYDADEPGRVHVFRSRSHFSTTYYRAVKTAIADITGDYTILGYEGENLKTAVEKFEQRKKEKKNPVSYEIVDVNEEDEVTIKYTLADGTTQEVVIATLTVLSL